MQISKATRACVLIKGLSLDDLALVAGRARASKAAVVLAALSLLLSRYAPKLMVRILPSDSDGHWYPFQYPVDTQWLLHAVARGVQENMGGSRGGGISRDIESGEIGLIYSYFIKDLASPFGGRDLLQHDNCADLAGIRQINLVCVEYQETIVCHLKGSDDIGDDFLAHLATRFTELIEAVACDIEKDVRELVSSLSDDALLGRWTWHPSHIDPERSLASLLQPAFEEHAHRIAVEDDDRALSYADLLKEATCLACKLAEAGVPKGAIIGVYCDRSVEMVVALLAVLRIGGAYLPLQPDLPVERLTFMAVDAGIQALIFHPYQESAPPQLGIPTVAVDTKDCAPVPYPQAEVLADDVAYVMYTSGSTGRPKGVANTNRGICNRLMWIQALLPLDQDAVVLQKTPFGFDVSVWEFFWPLMVGAKIVMARPGGHHDPHYIAEIIEARQVSLCHFVPSMLRIFLDLGSMAGQCRTLKHVLCSGEALPGPLREAFFQRLPDCRLHNLYGPTEAAIDVSHHECLATEKGDSVPIGRAAANTILAVVDAKGQLLPPGQQGELLIGGVQVASGYLNRPELNAERFCVLNYPPAAGPQRFYRTGDLACFNYLGEIEYRGRTDHQIKLRGVRIELGEIELVLARHPVVHDCIVVLDELTSTRLIGNVVVKAGEHVDPAELRGFAQSRLLAAMVPAEFRFWTQFPLTVNGKTDRNAIAKGFPQQASQMRVGTKPISEHQQALADIWREVLKVPVIHADDNFHDLGGESLYAGMVANRVRARFGVLIGAGDVLQANSFEALFDRIQIAPVVSVAVSSAKAEKWRGYLSSNQERLFFLNQHRPSAEMFNIPLAFRIRGHLDRELLSACIAALLRRHEMLRVNFEPGHEATLQHPSQDTGAFLSVVEPERTFDEALAVGHGLAKTPFDLTRDAPFRAIYIPTLEGDALLLLLVHHIAIDGRSEQLIVDELFADLAAGAPRMRPPLKARFLQYAAEQRAYADSGPLEKERLYWRQQLADAHAGGIPHMSPSKRVSLEQDGAVHRFTLTREAAVAVKALCHAHRETAYVVMLSAFALLLGRYSGERDLVIGTTSSFRPTEDMEDVVGFFINTLPLRLRIPTACEVGQFIKAVGDTSAQAIAHQALPYEQIIALAGQADSRSPLFNTLFSFEGAYPEFFQGPGYQAESLGLHPGPVQFDLSLHVTPREDDQYSARFEYRPSRYPDALVRDLARQLSFTLVSMRSVTDLSELGTADQEALSRSMAMAQGPFVCRQDAALVHEAILARAAHADLKAVVGANRGMSYAELDLRSAQIATCLKQRGVGRGDVVAVEAARDPETIAGFLAVLRIGAAYLPLDARLAFSTRMAMLEENRVTVLLANTAGAKMPGVETVIYGETNVEANADIDAKVDGDDIAYVIYTSGSTGKPNGVAVTHANLRNSTYARHDFYQESVGSFLLISPLYFDSSVAGIFWTLVQGGRLVLPSFDDATDLVALAALPDLQSVTHLLCVPSLYQLMIEDALIGRFSALRVVILAGEKLESDLVESHFDRCGEVALYNEYGPTEAAVWCSAWKAHRGTGSVPIGQPISNTSVVVLDEAQRLLPIGAMGEIHVGGLNVSKGYVGRPSLNAERFKVVDDALLYKTGDIGRYRPDGHLEYFGRRDNQIKVRGHRVEPEHIESVLNTHAVVRQSAVVVHKTADTEQLVAYIVAEAEGFDDQKVLAWIRELLPDYLCPSFLVLVQHLPRTATGKVNRKELARRPLPLVTVPDRVRPLTRSETLVHGVWVSLLGIEVIDPELSFFNVGGHSLLLMRLQRALNLHASRNIEVVEFFRYTTIAAQATLIEGGDEEKTDLHERPEKRLQRRIPTSSVKHHFD